MIRLIIFLSLIIPANSLSGQDFSFYKENITMKIEKEYFYVLAFII